MLLKTFSMFPILLLLAFAGLVVVVGDVRRKLSAIWSVIFSKEYLVITPNRYHLNMDSKDIMRVGETLRVINDIIDGEKAINSVKEIVSKNHS